MSSNCVGDWVASGVGAGVGAVVGAGVGFGVGAGVGSGVDSEVGSAVGAGVGFGVGAGVDSGVGFGVGAGVDPGVFPSSPPVMLSCVVGFGVLPGACPSFPVQPEAIAQSATQSSTARAREVPRFIFAIHVCIILSSYDLYFGLPFLIEMYSNMYLHPLRPKSPARKNSIQRHRVNGRCIFILFPAAAHLP